MYTISHKTHFIHPYTTAHKSGPDLLYTIENIYFAMKSIV